MLNSILISRGQTGAQTSVVGVADASERLPREYHAARIDYRADVAMDTLEYRISCLGEIKVILQRVIVFSAFALTVLGRQTLEFRSREAHFLRDDFIVWGMHSPFRGVSRDSPSFPNTCAENNIPECAFDLGDCCFCSW